jgi:hypothetical protein
MEDREKEKTYKTHSRQRTTADNMNNTKNYELKKAER